MNFNKNRIGLIAILALAGCGAPESSRSSVDQDTDPTVIEETAPEFVQGDYALDPTHASVIIKVAHAGGVSLTTFRFNEVSGSLRLPSTSPSDFSVSVDVNPASIDYPLTDFAADLEGERWLNTEAFPNASFTSSTVSATGPRSAQITGDLTLMGETLPIEVDAKLVGVGENRQGAPIIGFSGSTEFDRSAFGMQTLVGPVGDRIYLNFDIEFELVGE